MKKICYLWALVMILLLCGCQKENPEGSYTQVPMTPGSLEASPLRAEPGNYERSKELLTGSFVEIETGYYCMKDNYLYYADKENLSNWIIVCPEPECKHYEDPDCAALVENGLVLENGRFYFIENIDSNRHLYTGDSGVSGQMLCSMAQNGTDIRMEHVCEEALLSKGGDMQGWFVFPGGYVAAVARLNTDGTYSAQLWNIDGGQEQLLMEKVYDDGTRPMVNVTPARQMYGLRGDRAFCTGMIDGDPFRWVCWASAGQMHIADINEIPFRLKYLSGDILRTFVANDGYYDYNLLTGETIKLADAQLENSGAFILQPNCILESTMISSGDSEVEEKANQMENQSLRFFDGEQWHDVALPEEVVAVADSEYLGVRGLLSDCVMFEISTDGATESLYRMDLDAEHFKLEYCGTLNIP